jgi:gluconate 5-dehydrogenase
VTKSLELFDLSGKTAIVTGGGSGIGRQMAEGLAEAGANLVLCARRVERCEAAAEELSKLGVRTLALACDVRDPEQVSAVVARAREELGGVDVLVKTRAPSGARPLRTCLWRAGKRSWTSTSPGCSCSRRQRAAR